MVKRTFYLLTLVLFSSCEYNRTQEIKETLDSINENIENVKKSDLEIPNSNLFKREHPEQADEYSLTPDSRFYYLTLFDSEDKWMLFKAKKSDDIREKYPKLIVHDSLGSGLKEDYLELKKECLQNKMIFDIRDEAKGWLKENENKLSN